MAQYPPAQNPPGHSEHTRGNILGVRVDAVTMPQTMGCIDSWIARGEKRYVCVAAAHVVMDGYWNPDVRKWMNQAGLTVPDGMGTVWLLKWKGFRPVERIYGADLMLRACEQGIVKGWRHFFFGGEAGTADLLAARLAERFPGLQVAGTATPPFREMTPAEDGALIRQVEEARADILWLGISSIKQIRWMGTHLGKIDIPVMIGVGAVFDFLSGRKKQAPRFVQRSGLEWFFRLCCEPRRLWKRYVVGNTLFVFWLMKDKLTFRRK